MNVTRRRTTPEDARDWARHMSATRLRDAAVLFAREDKAADAETRERDALFRDAVRTEIARRGGAADTRVRGTT